jgi:hypothetical protein
VSLNERLFANARAIFEQKSPALMAKYSQGFIEEIARHFESAHTNYNIQNKGGDASD